MVFDLITNAAYVVFYLKILQLLEINNKNDRQQMMHLGIKPFASRIIEYRANKLCKSFPQYNKNVLHNFVETDPMA